MILWIMTSCRILHSSQVLGLESQATGKDSLSLVRNYGRVVLGLFMDLCTGDAGDSTFRFGGGHRRCTFVGGIIFSGVVRIGTILYYLSRLSVYYLCLDPEKRHYT